VLKLTAALLSLVFLLWACTANDLAAPKPRPSLQDEELIEPRKKVDILFLVDKSPTMADEQASLARNFPRFMEVLEAVEGGLPDIHLGVITQDVGAGGYKVGMTCEGGGDGGRLQNTPRIAGCRPPEGAFISDIAAPDGRERNYTGSLSDAFACIAQVGPNGCGFEQHLESLRRALDGSVPENAGFLRKDAYLAVVILSDEDDCSASDPGALFDPTSRGLMDPLGPVSDWRCAEFGWLCDGKPPARGAASYNSCVPNPRSPYLHHPDVFADFLRGLKDDPDKILVATIMGPSSPVRVALSTSGAPEVQPSCVLGEQNAEPMPRLAHFADRLSGGRNSFVSICQPDLSDGLIDIATTLAGVLAPCVQRPADADPREPGLQADCTVTELVGGSRVALPRCPVSGTRPCWKLTDSPACTGDRLGLVIERNGVPGQPDNQLSVKCLAP
jgi:hypothetical protein